MLARIKPISFHILAILVLFQVALAQTDPAGRAHAFALYNAYSNQDEATFRSLFFGDTNLTKRAFISSLIVASEYYQSGNSSGATEAALFAAVLAEAIASEFNDPVPQQIMDQFQRGDSQATESATAYALTLGIGGDDVATTTTSQTAATNSGASTPSATSGVQQVFRFYGEDKTTAADLPNFDFLRSLFTKIARINLALTYSDPKLILQEIDTFPQVFQVYKEVLTGSPEGRAFAQSIETQVELAKLTTQGEMGLVSDFSSDALALAKTDYDVNNTLSIYLTGSRLAMRQGEFDRAERLLTLAEQTLAKPNSEASPIFGFATKTGRFQLKMERAGVTPSASEVVSGFQSAWKELADYHAGKKFNDDIAWFYGRLSLKYWTKLLTDIGQQGEEELGKIAERSLVWAQEAFAIPSRPKPEDYLYHNNEVQGQIAVVLAVMDTVLQVVENNPDYLQEEPGSSEEIQTSFTALLTMLSSISDHLSLNVRTTGFPEYNLADSAAMVELKWRLRYLDGLNPSRSQAQRAEVLQSLLPQLANLSNPESYIDYHLRVGRQLRDLGRSDLATTAWERALRRADELNFRNYSLEASSLLAEEYGRQKNWQKASELASVANQNLLDELGASQDTSGESMAEKTTALSTLGATAAIKANAPEKALALISEAQQMNSAAVQLSGNKEAAAATMELKAKEKKVVTLTSKVEQLQQMPESSTRNEMLVKAQELLAETKAEFLTQSRNIRQRFARLYTDALRFDPLNLPEVQKSLPAGVAVVQYFPTDEALFIFVVTHDQFRLREVKLKKSELDQNIVTYLARMQKPAANDVQLATLSSQLYQALVTPIETDLAQVETVFLIPSGRLQLLPFSALTDAQGKLLIEKKRLLAVGKTTDLLKLKSTESKPITSVVAFANATKDLPAAEKEGERIAAMFPDAKSKLFVGDEASKSNLQSFGGKAEVLHLATHGVSNPTHPLENYLKFSKNQKLAQEEIFELNLENTSIVTLSACSTATAEVADDKNFMPSLAEAFWIAGSRSVVASLWPVDDNSTEILMTKFYERLKAGDDKAQALQTAQLEVRKDPRYGHPYFWSGFQLFGDYR